MEKKEIPKKNYAILVGMLILVVTFCFAFYNVYNIIEENSLTKSPLSAKSVLYDDLKNATKEIDADTFLVVSYTQDKVVNTNEKAIKKYLKKQDLLNNVMYLDITEYKNEEGFIEDLNKVLKLEDKNVIKQLPAVVYYKDSVATKTIDSRDHILNKGDFEQLIDMYELAS